MERQTAFKVWIKDVVGEEYVIDKSEQSPAYILINNNKVSSVNLIANVIQKYNSEKSAYTMIAIDDGSGVIRVKVWGEDIGLLNDVNIGDTINIIGNIRKSQDEIYITPRIVKKTDSAWIAARKAELTKIYSQASHDSTRVTEEKLVDTLVDTVARQRVLDIVRKYDGIDIQSLANESGMNHVEPVVNELLKEGEIFELKGKLRTIS